MANVFDQFNDDDEDDYFDDTTPAYSQDISKGSELHVSKTFEKYTELVRKQQDFLRQIPMPMPESSYLCNYWENADGFNHPIHLHSWNKEHYTGLFDVLKIPKNENLSKILAVFLYLISEIRNTTSNVKEKIFEPLIMYGEDKELPGNEKNEGDSVIYISKMVKIFNETYETCKLLSCLMINLINQFNALYSRDLPAYNSIFKKYIMEDAFDALGELLGVLISVDVIVVKNEDLAADWSLYKRMLSRVRNDLTKFNINERQMKRYEKYITKFDKSILSGSIFTKCIESKFEGRESDYKSKSIKDNKEFRMAFLTYLNNKANDISELIGISRETTERSQLIGLITNFALFLKIFKKDERELYKKIWKLQKKAPIAIIHCHILMSVGEFLKYYAIKKHKTVDPKDEKSYQLEHIKRLDSSFSSYVASFSVQVSEWMTTLNTSAFTNIYESRDTQNTMNEKIKLLVKGVCFACQLRNIIDELLLMHYNMNIILDEMIIVDILNALLLLKGIESEMYSKADIVSKLHVFMNRMLQNQLLVCCDQNMKNISQIKTTGKNELMGVFEVTKNILQSSYYQMGEMVLKLTLPVMTSKEFCREDLADQYQSQAWKLFTLNSWSKILWNVCQVKYLYKLKNLIPIFFEDLYKHQFHFSKLKYLIWLLHDPMSLMNRVNYLHDPNALHLQYKNDVIKLFRQNIVDKIGRDIENQLRIKVHTILLEQIIPPNPMKEGVNDYKRFLSTEPLFIFGEKIILKDEIEKAMTQTFYNMTALAPRDWNTYEEMRSLASHLYNLKFIESYLPPKQLEQGTDLLEIIRKLGSFVSNYHYNLHTQAFFERTNEARKNINVIGVTQIAHSLHTHGIGISNTMVNSVYRFLIKKFVAFSRFLFDDYIYSPLFAERKWYKDHKNELENKYPIERAEQLAAQIKKLGEAPDGRTYLDKFRQLITQMGNSIGFIRILRCAYLRYSNDIMKFTPEYRGGTKKDEKTEEEKNKYKEITANLGLALETHDAADVVDNILYQVNSLKVADYLKMLINIIDEESLKSDENKHLDLFHIMIPALSTNYVTATLQAKTTLNKKNMSNTYMTDDGFAVGIAYLLKVLQQEEHFNALNWFESVTIKFEREKKEKFVPGGGNPTNPTIGKKGPSTASTEYNMAMLKTTSYQQEYEWLFYSFEAAQRFFKEDD